MLRVFKLMNIRNRAYVVDSKGNKLFYGTEFQCKKFIEYMKEDDQNETGTGTFIERENSASLVRK